MTDRQAWLRVLALTPFAELSGLVAELAPLPPFEHLRGPEIGLAMVRGRAGGNGQPFNFGEMTVTRCALRVMVADDETHDGFGCVAGRSPRQAEIVALCDALLQSERWRPRVVAGVIRPAERLLASMRAREAQRRAATKADFVTVVRSGEG
jgi:alpha-D-ribose 1-methylphosphonate 5-triphosphate synthase subunit PhnG